MNPNGSKWIRRPRRLAVYMRDGFSCVYCGESLNRHRPETITLDHVDSRAYFGTPDHSNDNIVTCCIPCNKAKGDRLLVEWNPAMVDRVNAATGREVPHVMAVSLYITARGTKRLTPWRVAVRRAQAFITARAAQCMPPDSIHEPGLLDNA